MQIGVQITLRAKAHKFDNLWEYYGKLSVGCDNNKFSIILPTYTITYGQGNFFLAIHNIPAIFFYLSIIYRDACTHKFQELLKYYKEHLKIGSFSMISISLPMYVIIMH